MTTHPATAPGPAATPVDDDAVLLAAIDRSRLAPSIFNTQPWRWRVAHGVAELRVDRSRSLPALDPTGRELIVSCGAALFHLRAALTAQNLAPLVATLPEPSEPALLARVRLGEITTSGDLTVGAALALDGVAPARTTNRHRFDGGVPDVVVDSLRDAAERERSVLMVLTDVADRTLVKVWQQVADAAQTADPAYRRDLQAWTRDEVSPDGILVGPGATATTHDFASRDFSLGAVEGEWEPRDDHDTLLLVLATLGDEPREWLQAGQSLARLWLEATLAGVVLQPLTQSVENAAARQSLRRDLQMGDYYPQLVLRGGFAPTQAASPRRPLADILDAAP